MSDERRDRADDTKPSKKPRRRRYPNPILAAVRNELGLTQEEVAQKLNEELPMSEGPKHRGKDVSRWETANRPRMKTQRRLAAALGRTREELGFVRPDRESQDVASTSAVREDRLTGISPPAARPPQKLTNLLRRVFEI